jgi:hypothetical protein
MEMAIATEARRIIQADFFMILLSRGGEGVLRTTRTLEGPHSKNV